MEYTLRYILPCPVALIHPREGLQSVFCIANVMTLLLDTVFMFKSTSFLSGFVLHTAQEVLGQWNWHYVHFTHVQYL